MMTLAEILKKIPEDNIYPSIIDTATRATIYDWYQYREVCDDEKFPLFFRRQLIKDWSRYQQLLRIEPGITQYDWMVESYLERQIVSMEQNKQNATKNGKRSSTMNGTQESATTGTNGATNTRTFSGKDTTASTVTTTGTSTETRNGQETQTGTLTANLTHSGTDTTTNSTTNNYGAQNSTTSTKNNQARTTTISGAPTSYTSTDHGEQNASKIAPMDAQVLASTPAGGSSGAGDLAVDFSGYASEINQARTADRTTTNQTLDETRNESFSGNADTVTVNTAEHSDNANGTTSTNYGHKEDRTENTGATNTRTEGGKVDANSSDETSSETVYGQVITDTATGTNGETTNAKTNGTTTDETTEETEGAGERNTDTREILSGRHKEPAQIMRDVVDFVESTNAWTWFSSQLDLCFAGFYDI